MATGTPGPASEKTGTLSLVTLTERAIKEIKVILKEQEVSEETVLRIGIIGGGCAGFQYHMALEEQPQEDDELIEVDGVKLVIDPISLQYLKGATIDFQDTLQGRGFVFDNPNVPSTCGCGRSFQS